MQPTIIFELDINKDTPKYWGVDVYDYVDYQGDEYNARIDIKLRDLLDKIVDYEESYLHIRLTYSDENDDGYGNLEFERSITDVELKYVQHMTKEEFFKSVVMTMEKELSTTFGYTLDSLTNELSDLLDWELELGRYATKDK